MWPPGASGGPDQGGGGPRTRSATRPSTPRAASRGGHFRCRGCPLLKSRAWPVSRQAGATPPPLPPAGRQPPQMPSHRIDPSPTSRGSGHPVLNRPDTLAPAGRSGPQPSPRRGRPAASPAWRPRGSPSSALRRSNVTWQAPTATPRANRDARPVLSAPRAASRLDPVRRPPPLPSTPAPTPAQFHLYSQAQGKVPRTRALSALTSRERTDSSPSARREPNRCLRAHCRRRRRLYRRRRCCTRVLVRRR